MTEYYRKEIAGTPELQTFIRKFVSKGKVKVFETSSVSLNDYWDGGSRTYTTFFDVKSGEVISDEQANFVQQKEANPLNFRMGSVQLSDDLVVVQEDHFRGKARMYIYVKSMETIKK